MRPHTQIKNPFSAIALLVPLFLRLMGGEGQADAEMTDDVDKHVNPNSTSMDEIQQQMEEGNSHGGAKEEPQETTARSTEINQQIKEDDHKEETARQKKLGVLLELASFEILIGFSALITVDFLHQGCHHQSPRLAIFCFLAFLTLLTGFCLLFQTLFMLATRIALITQIHRSTSKVLVFISITSLILTSLSPVTLLPEPYYILPSIFIPVLVTLGFYFYIGMLTNHEIEVDGTRANYNEQLKVITRLSELNQGLASLSSSGLIGILFGSWTDTLNHAHHPYVKTSVLCMFFTFISSLLLMFLCQMRVDLLSSKARVSLIRTIKCFCAFLLIMLAVAALAVSSYFLKEYIVAILLPALVAGIVGFSVEFCTTGHDNAPSNYPEDKLKVFFTTANKVTALSFGTIMGIFGAYLGSQETDMNLKIFMFFMASAFISGIMLMLMSYEAPKKASMGVIFCILGCFGICFLAFGGLSIFFLVLLRI